MHNVITYILCQPAIQADMDKYARNGVG